MARRGILAYQLAVVAEDIVKVHVGARHDDPEATVRQGHEVTERVKARLLAEGPEVLDVVVHLEPYVGPATEGPGRKRAGTPLDPSGTKPANGPDSAQGA